MYISFMIKIFGHKKHTQHEQEASNTFSGSAMVANTFRFLGLSKDRKGICESVTPENWKFHIPGHSMHSVFYLKISLDVFLV